MKKLLLILLLLGTFTQQSEAKIQAGVGIKVGPACGRWNNGIQNPKLATAGGTVGYQVGLHAGVQARIWFNKFVGLNLAGEFNMSGSTFTRIQDVNTFKQTHKENQVTIPLTAMVGWGNERLRVFGNVGGFFGYNVSGTDKAVITLNGSTQPNDGNVKSDYKDVYNAIDAGIRLGAGLQVYVDKKLKSCVTFDINYDYGLIKSFKNEEPAYFPNPEKIKLTSSKLLIGVGYSYTFGKSQAEEKPKRASDFITE
ncbi:MAG: porin family protein [Chitinophagales bacterium]